MDLSLLKELLNLMVLIVFPVTGWLIVRVLKGIDTNQKTIAKDLSSLWEKHNELSQNFHELKGEHRVNHAVPERRHTVHL